MADGKAGATIGRWLDVYADVGAECAALLGRIVIVISDALTSRRVSGWAWAWAWAWASVSVLVWASSVSVLVWASVSVLALVWVLACRG
jgi:hypothetical protein